MKRSVKKKTTLSVYGPTQYGYGHLTSGRDMHVLKHYRASVIDTLAFFEDMLEELLVSGVPVGSELEVTIKVKGVPR